MQVLVQAKNIAVTPTIKSAIERQVSKLSRLSSKIVRVLAFLEVVGKKKNDSQAARVMFHIQWPGKDLVVEERAVDIYDAIVDTAESAKRTLRKHKERRRDYRTLARKNHALS